MRLSPRNIAVLEVVRQRLARGAARVVFFSLALTAVGSTVVVAALSVKIIFAALKGDAPSLLGLSAGLEQWAAAGAIVACMIASSVWDVWRSAEWSKGWRKNEMISEWDKGAVVYLDEKDAPRLIVRVGLVLGAPYTLAAERLELPEDSSIIRWLSMEKALLPPSATSGGLFVNKDDASIAPLKSALFAIPRVCLRVPLWAIMGLSALASFMLVGVLGMFVLIEMCVDRIKAAREEAAEANDEPQDPQLALNAAEVSDAGFGRPLTLKARLAGIMARVDIKARVSNTLDQLASQAPETLAAAEAKALARAAPENKSRSSKKKMRI